MRRGLVKGSIVVINRDYTHRAITPDYEIIPNCHRRTSAMQQLEQSLGSFSLTFSDCAQEKEAPVQ